MKTFLVIIGLVFLVNGCYRKLPQECILRIQTTENCFSLYTKGKNLRYDTAYFYLSSFNIDCKYIVLDYDEKKCIYPDFRNELYSIDYYDKIVFTTKYDYNQTYKAGDTINDIVGDIRYEYRYLKEFEKGKCNTIPPCARPSTVTHHYNTFQQMMNDQKDTARVGKITFKLLEPPDSVRNFNIYMHIRFKDGREFTISLPQDIIIRPN
jgi:hypothetical protein